MDKILQIYTATDNKGGVQNFPYIDEEPLRIVDFSFSGSRMEIPTLTASVKHKECLDSKWNYKQFVEFRGEKYWVSKIPSSSKDNTDHRYKHDVTFVSERNILSNIYFYDIVDAESESGKYHSNSSKVLFYGTISELVDRINASLKYSGVDYVVAIKEGEIPADKLAVTKEFSCENVFVFDALKQAFETWDIPFYFVGKNCYFGFGEELGKDSLKYGKNNGLLKIERTNGNTRIITRATGLGSTENIPFYYPNMSEKGDFTFTLKRKDGTIIPVEIIDQNKVATTIPDSVTYEFTDKSEYSNAYINTIEVQTAYGEPWKGFFLVGDYVNVSLHDDPHSIRVWFTVDNFDNVIFDFRLNTENHGSFQLKDFKSISLYDVETNQPIQTWFGINTSKITTDFKNGLSGSYYFLLSELDIFRGGDIIDEEYQYTFETVTISTVTSKEETTKIYKWIPKDVDNARNFTSLKYLGIDYVETEADLEGTFVMNIIPNSKVPYQERLMPSIFSRGTAFNGNVTATRGVERFYNAKNSTYPNIEFTNELNEFNRSENIYQYDDIKPSIAKVTNANGELIGQVLDVAFDKNDNDDVYGEEYGDKSNNYIHPYFYIKLHTFDGDLGFNLFNRATEKDAMTIQMTSGDLNGCKFKIQVIDKGNNIFANPVQVYTQADVDKEGSTITEDMIGQIVTGDSDKKISRSNFIESQQDTRKNEVWIAVLKDTDTFGTILPSSVTNLVVKRGDTFNITGIHMPESYILAAEQWLDESIVSDMADENIEAFNFAIDFSRIFLQEDYETNKENSWVAKLTESARIPVQYDGTNYLQYVTSYTYECKGTELLPKISVGLSNTIAKGESYADAIVKKSTTTITQSAPRIVKTQIANSNLAVKSNTLSGYGITDAKIDDDGTLVLGTASVVIPKETTSLDWSQITNKPDYFELDENGDVKVKGGKGLWTESFLSTKGTSIDTGTGGDGSGGIGINAMWTELAREDSSRIIDYSHMPSSVKTAINWVSSVTGSDADSQINKWNEIVSFLSGISDTSSLNSILSGKANTSVVTALETRVTTIESNYVAKTRKISAGTGLTGGGTLNADVTLSLATIGTAGTYTKVVVDAYGRVTGNSALLASDIPQLEMGQINGLANELEAYSQLIESSVQESEFAAFFAQEMAKWFVLDSENKGIKTANGYGFYSESYISSKGLSDDTTGGSGIDVSSLWAELADDGTEQIAKNHLVDALNGYATQSWVTSQNYLTEITKSSIISALGYTPFNASNFTKSNIQSTLGISDWALASTKPSYTKSDVGLGNVSNLAATEYLTSLSSDTTNAVSITIGGTSKNISVGTMRTSLGLGSFAYKNSLAFADLDSKPSTLSGYGITDAYTKAQVNTELGKYLSLAGGKMANTNLVTNLNADLLDGYNADDLFKGRLKINSQISVSAEGWYTIASITTNGFNERGTIHFAIRTTGGDFRPYVTHYYINSSWTDGESNIFTNGIGVFITGIRLTQTGNNNDGGTRNIELCFSRDFTGYLIVLYSAYDNDGIINDNFTWNTGALPIADNSAEVWKTLDLYHGINTDKQIRTTNALYADSVVIGGVTLSWDYTNGMLKLDKGAYFLGPVSTKGVSNETGTGGTGVDLSAVWDSLSKNTDIYGSTKIHLDHIPTLTKSKISDFPTLVSAFANDAGYITASAIINKADKATTLAGYGITDAVPFLNMVNASNLKSIGVGYVNANGANGENGGIISFGSASHQTQIHSDYSGGNIHWRVNSNGTLTNWKNLLDANNYSNYAVTLNTNQTISGVKTLSANLLSATSGTLDIGDGYNSFNRIFVWHYKSNSLTKSILSSGKWYRIWNFSQGVAGTHQKNAIISINKAYNYEQGQTITLAVSINNWGQTYVINQLSGTTGLISKVRVTGKRDYSYVDVYISSAENAESYSVSGYGNGERVDFEELADDATNDSTRTEELTVVNGTAVNYPLSLQNATPLVVNSTTMVANLNANYLGGLNKDSFQKAVYDYVNVVGTANDTALPTVLAPSINSIGGSFKYYDTKFYNGRSNTSNRCQLAYGYDVDSIHFRRYKDGTWYDWKKVVFTEGEDNIQVTNAYARFTANNGSLSGFFGFSGNVIGAYSTSLAEWLISASTSAICIAPQGKVNVGVKTWTPAYDFHVNGSIGANSLTIGQATISWDSVNGMLKVNTGAYFTGPVSTKGVSGGSGLVAVAQFGITWHDAWAIDANSTYVESFGTTNKSISGGQGTTNGSTITIDSDAFSGKKIGDIEIFTLGWENEAPANVRLSPYKISGNTLYCALLLSGTMSQATFKIKIY